MPDGSSSAAPVINPGPRFEKNLRNRPCRTNARLAALVSAELWPIGPPCMPPDSTAPGSQAGPIAYPGRNGVLLRVSILLGADIDGVGHLRERPGLCGRLRGLLPAGRGALHGRG